MAGTLHHCKKFEQPSYVGRDGLEHFELRGLDGDSEGLCATTWTELKVYSDAHGIPSNVWPEFQCSIDLDPTAIVRANERLSERLQRVPAPVLAGYQLLRRIAEWRSQAYYIYYTIEF